MSFGGLNAELGFLHWKYLAGGIAEQSKIKPRGTSSFCSTLSSTRLPQASPNRTRFSGPVPSENACDLAALSEYTRSDIRTGRENYVQGGTSWDPRSPRQHACSHCLHPKCRRHPPCRYPSLHRPNRRQPHRPWPWSHGPTLASFCFLTFAGSPSHQPLHQVVHNSYGCPVYKFSWEKSRCR